jgi:hypothetical protein
MRGFTRQGAAVVRRWPEDFEMMRKLGVVAASLFIALLPLLIA